MHGADGAGGQGFKHEVAVGHRVERVARRAVEAQCGRRHVAVDGEARSGKGRSTQRVLVHALSCIGQPRTVARQHLDIGQHVVAEGHRLGDLQVGEARHDGGGVSFRLAGKRELQRLQLGIEVVDRVTHIEAEVERHLVIARARRVKAPGGGANDVLQAGFDVEMDVFQRARERERAGLDLGLHLLEALPNECGIGFRDDSLGGQHRGMGFRACDVLGEQALVEADRGVDLFHDRVRPRLETPAPHLVGHRNSFIPSETPCA